MNATQKLYSGLFLAAFLAAVVVTAAATHTVYAQETETTVEHGAGFVDADGDGYNDNAPDTDGDGVPNGQDSDYAGSGRGSSNGHGRRFVDEDGDGFNDNAPDADGDGIPNGQDDDYSPQGQAARHKNNAAVKNTVRSMGQRNGNGYKNGYGRNTEGRHNEKGKGGFGNTQTQ